MNQEADMLSRNNVSSEEWTLHPLAVHRIWEIFGKAWVDLFASKDNSHCPIFFTRSTDALAHEWPSLPLYAFPPVALLPQVLRQVREQRHKLILIPHPPLEEPTVGVRVIPAAESSSMTDHLETGPPFSSECNYKQFQALYPKCKHFSNLENAMLKFKQFQGFQAPVRILFTIRYHLLTLVNVLTWMNNTFIPFMY